ncbi:hypothetical protein Tsubulata_006624 [Turnera subulata]|uniref:Growth-regulating factor n=1 Tax=Turnera subulata TaxID=218843 RepID=A0A9Q0FDC6_9ROSI|nr:hypothetical protein Tsubulata_006624 [Turnera subulata]
MSNSTVTVAAVPPRAAAGAGAQTCFTVAQWQELEHQALIFKYLKAGLSVPPNLLLPIRKSFHLFSTPFFTPPPPTSTLNYYPYYGKKIDSEPGRCRRTDGKKWRCSKDAHPDSKYCERHMNRSRNRSRKPVESKTTTTPPHLSISTSSSSSSPYIAPGSNSSSSRAFTFPDLSLPSPPHHETPPCYGSNVMRWQTESTPYGISLNTQDCRSLRETKSEADKQTFVPETYGSGRNPGINNATNNSWCLASEMHSNPLQEQRNSALLLNRSSQLQVGQDFEPLTIGGAMSKQQQQQQQQYIFGRELPSAGPMRQEYENYQPLQLLFDEWPKCKDLDPYLVDQRSNKNASPVQLSMAIPMAPNSSVKSFHFQDGEFV